MKPAHYTNSQWSFDEDGMTSTTKNYSIDRKTIVEDGDVIEHLVCKVWVDPILAIDCYLRALQYYKTGRFVATFVLTEDKTFIRKMTY